MSESANALPKNSSLYDRLGGRDVVREIVERFFERVNDDPDLKSLYDHPNIVWLKENQVDFLSRALGGPALSAQHEQQEAHADLWKEERYFFSLAAHLRGAMLSIGIPPLRIDEVVAVLSPWSTQRDSLGSGKSFGGWNGLRNTETEWAGSNTDWFGGAEAPGPTADETVAGGPHAVSPMAASTSTAPEPTGDLLAQMQLVVRQLEAVHDGTRALESSAARATELKTTAMQAAETVEKSLVGLQNLRAQLAGQIERGCTLTRMIHETALQAMIAGLRPDLASTNGALRATITRQGEELDRLTGDLEECVTAFQAEGLMLRAAIESLRPVVSQMRSAHTEVASGLDGRLQQAESLGQAIANAVRRE